MGAQTVHDPIIIPADRVGSLDEHPLGAHGGATLQGTWTDGRSSAGVMHIDAGQHLGEHAHRRHHHHVWVVSGRTRVLGHELGAGSYAHIPSGVAHDFEALGASSCTVFYLYQEDRDDAAG